jgi:amino acid adenylation domain-containing protein
MSDKADVMTPMQKAVMALKILRSRNAELEEAAHAPIAIVGMGCRYPAGGNDPAAFWRALETGCDGAREVPGDRWDVDALYDPTPGAPGKMYVRKSCFIDGVDRFDPLFFRMSPREAVGVDPQQRLLLEVAWEALEDAGIAAPTLVGSRTGVFLGISTNDYSALLSKTAQGSGSNASAGAGNAASVASGRLSYTFGFQGPCMAVDTACSSSLVATHLAVQSLRNRESNLALAAGVNLMLAPDITINFCQGRMLSPDGACKTFDAGADGYVRGEGCGVLVLKRLADAQADGDRVIAVIRGSAVNQDGRSAGLTAPNGLAQEAVIRQALANARLDPDAMDYIEAHGTGTALGDPIEMQALKAVFGKRDRALYVGAVKTNIGHAEAASGVAGLIKAAQMLRHQVIPPNLHFTRLNPHIDLTGVDIRVPVTRVEGPVTRVGVSSFGFSGTNAHLILETAPPVVETPVGEDGATPKLLISARTPQALAELIGRYRRFLAETTESFRDIAHTAAGGRARLAWWVLVGSAEDLEDAQPSNAPHPTLPATSGRRVTLPAYPFERERYWIDGGEAQLTAATLSIEDGPPLLGRRISLPLSGESRWESVIRSGRPALAFLADHVVAGTATLPAACYVEMLLAAFPGHAVVDLRIPAPFATPVDATRRVQTIVGPGGDFRVVSVAMAEGDETTTVHAVGRVEPAGDNAPPLTESCETPVPTDTVYDAMAALGVRHGPAMRLLDRVTRADGAARAALTAPPAGGDFVLHPATLDAALSLVSAALPAVGDALLVPSRIGRVTLFRRPKGALEAACVARRDDDRVSATVEIRDADGVCLRVEDLTFDRAAAPNPHGFHQRIWRDQPLFAGRADFFPAAAPLADDLAAEAARLGERYAMAGYAEAAAAMETFASRCVVRAFWDLGFDFRPGRLVTPGALAESLSVADQHTRLFRRLLDILEQDGALTREGVRWRVAETAPPRADDEALVAECADLAARFASMAGEIAVLRRCGMALAGVLTGAVDPLGLLFPADGSEAGAGAFYQDSAYAHTVNGLLRAAMGALVGTLPAGRGLRVLEIGAGTGGATGAMLEGLGDKPAHYLFTDVSPAFLAEARRKFKRSGLRTAVLDIEADPLAQGLAEGGFDVVLAANVLHATRDIVQGLQRIGHLLAPGGMLLLIESASPRRWVDIVFGLTEGWWRFTDTDLRPNHPLLDATRWDKALRQAGFEPGVVAGCDIIVARKPTTASASSPAVSWHVAGSEDLASALTAAGGRIVAAEDAAHWVQIVDSATGDLAGQTALMRGLADLARAMDERSHPPRLTLIAEDSLAHAGLSGFVRTLAMEQPDLRARLLVTESALPVSRIAAELLAMEAEADEEIRLTASGRQGARLSLANVAATAPKIGGAWLITGGFGGLGLEIARWLAARGAARLILLGRRLPDPLPEIGAPIQAVVGDAADEALLTRLLAEAGDVEGVIHAAGALANAPAAALNDVTIDRVLRGKIGGALALDRATRAHPVKRFILFASAAGVLGSARQANHAFASAFLDGLAASRRAEGLPGLSLDWGVWSGVGAAARLGFDRQAEQLGLGNIAPGRGVAAFAAALGSDGPQGAGCLLVLPSVDWSAFTGNFDGAAPQLYAEVAKTTAVMESVAPPPPPTAPRPVAADPLTAVTRIVREVLSIAGTVDPQTPLYELGLDSLVAVEIKNRVQAAFGVEISVRDLIEGASIAAIVAQLPTPEAAPVAVPVPPSAAPDVADRVAAIVCDLLGLKAAPDPQTPLYELGLDSLVAVEIKNRVEKELGGAVSVRDLIEGASLASIVTALQGERPAPVVESSKPTAIQPPAPTGRAIVADLANRHAPFPLTEMQQAYWFGRRDDLELGAVGCYLYTEFDSAVLDLDRVERAFNRLIRRHDMLRMVIEADGRQRILPEVPEYKFQVLDLRGQDPGPELERLRRELPRRVAEPAVWPLFEVRVTLFETMARIHTGFDLIALDAASMFALRQEWGRLYDDLNEVLPPIGLSFRDYVLEELAYRETADWRRAERYWAERAATLPGGPDLPVIVENAARKNPRFVRHRVVIPAPAAEALRGEARRHGLTLSTLMAAAYADTLAAWSRNDRFCLTVTSFNRPGLHPDIGSLVGDFTSTILLEVDATAPRFDDRAATLSRRLADDLNHAAVSGIHVLRLMNRQRGTGVRAIPVVFTSALGFRRPGAVRDAVDTDATGWDRLGTTVFNVSSTPQVWIDQQISEEDGKLLCNWDVVEGLFPDGVVERMVAAYQRLLEELADGRGWDRPVSAVAAPLSRAGLVPVAADEFLHAAFVRQARATPDRVAVVAPDETLDYATLDAASSHLAATLASFMGGPAAARDRLIAIGFAKGWRQIVAALAILKVGAAYLPVDPGLPEDRRRHLLVQGDALALTNPALLDAALEAARAGKPTPTLEPVEDPARLAYVIYTSGSTGLPKGVMIEHKAAWATVQEVNRRWGVGPDDRALGLSALNFDLSVYDIFGPLSVGGALILPPPEANRDPAAWAGLLSRHRVTLWNSVPTLMAMQLVYGLPADHRLRLALLSGDWLPVELARSLHKAAPAIALVSLGGATEAAIWSNAQDVDATRLDPAWTSIPYGTPLAGHDLHVVNRRGEDCPDWVTGEIEISGQGLARGYWRDPQRTAERFRIDPLTGTRRYRTGDVGRFRPYAGNPPGLATPIEFLGREDFQVKIQGHRIELGEIEAALSAHEEVGAAVAVVATGEGDAKTLRAFVVPKITPPAPAFAAVAAIAQRAAEDTAKAGSPEIIDDATFADLSRRLSENAAAAAAAALAKLAGRSDLPDRAAFIARHGVAPRYADWLDRMLPQAARAGGAAAPFSQLGIDNPLGFGPDALAMLDAVIADLPDILTEKKHSSTIYLSDQTPEVYGRLFAAPNAIVGAALAALAAEKPLSVLEVGGGLATTLSAIIPGLPVDRLRYRFTDVSRHMVDRARRLFSDHPWISFDLLDLDHPPAPEPQRYDVILASSALHVAADLRRSLAGLVERLAPGGTLILVEQTRFLPWFDLNMGLQSGFDSRTDRELRPLHPLLARDGWRAALTAAGFTDIAEPRVVGSLSDRMGFDVLIAAKAEDAAAPRRLADDGLAEALRHSLTDTLPSYMVPQTITVIDRLSLSANGKVDRGALSALAMTSDSPASAAALSALETQVAALVAEALNQSNCDPDRSLFELGATSLTLVGLQRRLSERFGRVIGLQALFEKPTIRHIAQELTGTRAATGALVGFDTRPRSGDTRPKLVMMPGIFALPFYLRDMAAALADDVACVSVQLPGLFGAERPIDTVEAQADYVVRELRRAQPQGPYLIGGHSYGGCIAIEVARRLRDAGESVPLLVLGDTVRTRTRLTDFQTDDIAHTAMTRGLYALYGKQLTESYETLAHLSPAEQLARTAHAIAALGLMGPISLPITRMIAMFKANFRALGAYDPAPIPGDMVVIRTEGGFPVEFHDYEPDDSIKDPGLGWTPLVQGGLEVRTMPGDHLSILDTDNLSAMTDIFKALVREAMAPA